VRDAWQAGVFDAQRRDDARWIIESWLLERGHLRAEVNTSVVERTEQEKRVLFEIFPGPRYSNIEVVFEGAAGIEPKELADALDDAKLDDDIYHDPNRVTQFLTGYYRERGYLAVEVSNRTLDVSDDTSTGRVVIPIKEGPQFRVGEITFAGNNVYNNVQLREAVALRAGEVYTPGLREESLVRLRNLYQQLGYLDVDVAFEVRREDEQGQANIHFALTENKASIIEEIVVRGMDNTSENLVRTQMMLRRGDALNPERTSESRRNLYRTGAFALVDIEPEVMDADDPAVKPVRLNVSVREIQPYQILYGGFFDTDRGPGAIVDVANRNSLGSARVLGLRTRYDRQIREGRLYFTQPLLRRLPLQTTAFTQVRREMRDAFTVDRFGGSLLQEAHLGDRYILNYGYRFEQTHTYDRAPVDPDDPFDFRFDERVNLAPLTAALTRDTRDDLLDATRGSFFSQAAEWATSRLASDVRYMRYFGQYFRYIALQGPQDVPLSSIRKPRLVYAGAVRLGLAGGLGGQELVFSERFFAGGGTTMRGFRQDKLGPKDVFGDPIGGNAMFITNQEIRFPLFWILDGVGFVDVGNVWARVSDISFTDLRRSAGVGLRVRTPYFLLRMDYGLKLDPRNGEPRSAIFFSIGQAF
jgi:outer membrane protein assembly complex protein YaeT